MQVEEEKDVLALEERNTFLLEVRMEEMGAKEEM
jgi:hypothetical protein